MAARTNQPQCNLWLILVLTVREQVQCRTHSKSEGATADDLFMIAAVGQGYPVPAGGRSTFEAGLRLLRIEASDFAPLPTPIAAVRW